AVGGAGSGGPPAGRRGAASAQAEERLARPRRTGGGIAGRGLSTLACDSCARRRAAAARIARSRGVKPRIGVKPWGAPFDYRAEDLFRATAARMSALKASTSTSSP